MTRAQLCWCVVIIVSWVVVFLWLGPSLAEAHHPPTLLPVWDGQ